MPFWSGAFDHHLFYLSGLGVVNYANWLTPALAQAIDSKIDDGLPGMGAVYGGAADGWVIDANYAGGGGDSCLSAFNVFPATNPQSYQYDLSNTNRVCNLAFFAGF